MIIAIDMEALPNWKFLNAYAIAQHMVDMQAYPRDSLHYHRNVYRA